MRYRVLCRLRAIRVRLFSYFYVVYLRLLGVRVSFTARFYGPVEIRGSAETIVIGEHCLFQRGIVLSTAYRGSQWGSIDIGNGVALGDGVIISAERSIVVGDGVSIAAYCYLVDHDHALPDRDSPVAPILVSPKVWVGTHAVILKGVTVGEGTVVAAGSVLTRSVPAGCVVAGVPARVVRQVESGSK